MLFWIEWEFGTWKTKVTKEYMKERKILNKILIKKYENKVVSMTNEQKKEKLKEFDIFIN